MKINGIYILFIFFSVLTSLQAQQVNPFDIKERLEQSELESGAENETQVAEKAQSSGSIEESVQASEQSADLNNPFEIRIDKKPIKTQSKEPEQAKEEIIVDEEPVIGVVLDTDSSDLGNFLFWIILFAFLILAVTLSLDRWYISKLFKSIFNYNLSNTLMRETNGFNLIILLLLYTLFLISSGVFVYLINRYFTGNAGLNWFWICFGAVVGVYFIRHIAMRVVSYIFPNIPEFFQFNFTIASFNVALGIALLIPSLLIAYSPDQVAFFAIILGIAIWVLVYLLRSFRGLLLSFNYLIGVPIHFFLYLCAFEIIPLMVMYKLIADFV